MCDSMQVTGPSAYYYKLQGAEVTLLSDLDLEGEGHILVYVFMRYTALPGMAPTNALIKCLQKVF